MSSTRWDGHARRRMIGEGTLTLTIATVRALQDAAAHAPPGAVPRLSWNGVTFESVTPQLVQDPAPFGGFRYWLRCPTCHTRRRELYTMPPQTGTALVRWRCRPCMRLAYPAQRLAPLDRLQRQRQRLAARIARQSGEWWDMIPPRPKGMHWTRYERELERLAALDTAIDRQFNAGCARLLKRINRCR